MRCFPALAWRVEWVGAPQVGRRDVPRDPAKAALYLQRACDNGFAPSCQNLAVLYDSGDGVGKDGVKARQLLNRAADLMEAQTGVRIGTRFAVPSLPPTPPPAGAAPSASQPGKM